MLAAEMPCGGRPGSRAWSSRTRRRRCSWQRCARQVNGAGADAGLPVHRLGGAVSACPPRSCRLPGEVRLRGLHHSRPSMVTRSGPLLELGEAPWAGGWTAAMGGHAGQVRDPQDVLGVNRNGSSGSGPLMARRRPGERILAAASRAKGWPRHPDRCADPVPLTRRPPNAWPPPFGGASRRQLIRRHCRSSRAPARVAERAGPYLAITQSCGGSKARPYVGSTAVQRGNASGVGEARSDQRN